MAPTDSTMPPFGTLVMVAGDATKLLTDIWLAPLFIFTILLAGRVMDTVWLTLPFLLFDTL